MDILPSLRRVRTRMHAMERGLKTLRSEVEQILLAFDDDDGLDLHQINCGLTRLLAEGDDIALRETQPYAEFAEGVWCSFDQNTPGTRLLVSTKTAGRREPMNAGGISKRICVHPVFTAAERPLWCTLEFAIDPAMFKAAKAVRLDFSAYFDIAPGATVALPSTSRFQVRLREKGETRDVVERHFPITTMSFDQSIEISETVMTEMAAQDAEEAFGIITLPQSGTYTFNIERFNIYALNG